MICLKKCYTNLPKECNNKRVLFFVGVRAVTVKEKIEETHLDSSVEVDDPAKSTIIISNVKSCKRYPSEPIDSQSLSKHRANIREVLLCSNATAIRRYNDLGYMCCYCYDQHPVPADLKKHTLETHHDVDKAYFMSIKRGYQFAIKLDITALECKICKTNIDTIEQMLEHLKNDHQKTIYTDIKNLIIPFKFETEKLQCCICMAVFNKFRMLIEHMNKHYRNYVCEICDSGFRNISSFKAHRLLHDTGSFKCDYCSQEFDTKNKRWLHERTKHRNKKSVIKCGHCNETFTNYRQKEAHIISAHGGQTQKCQSCDKFFMNTKALNSHVRRNHLMERPHECPECDMKFFKKNELRNHLVKHTGLRIHKCTICLKSYGRAKTLREHMKIHDDIRRFKCEHCGQAFVQKCSWRGHMKTKHDEIV